MKRLANYRHPFILNNFRGETIGEIVTDYLGTQWVHFITELGNDFGLVQLDHVTYLDGGR